MPTHFHAELMYDFVWGWFRNRSTVGGGTTTLSILFYTYQRWHYYETEVTQSRTHTYTHPHMWQRWWRWWHAGTGCRTHIVIVIRSDVIVAPNKCPTIGSRGDDVDKTLHTRPVQGLLRSEQRFIWWKLERIKSHLHVIVCRPSLMPYSTHSN